MFYSHQILARKGPLATVWMAAHLHDRLKKPHYNSVDINSTIDRIIWPEAPIALRMSGHLLLGVVRIYSKKVDYLYNDCNDAMVKVTKVVTHAERNVNEVMTSAPVDDVTLPERYELDAMTFDAYVISDREADNFIRSPEDITLPDSNPINMDQYFAMPITFEDIDMTPIGSNLRGLDSDRERDAEPSAADRIVSSGGAGPGNGTEVASEGFPGVSGSGFVPMEEDLPMDTSEHLKEAVVGDQTSAPGPSNQQEAIADRIHEQQSPQSIEMMRHALPDSTLPDFPLPYETTDEAGKQKAAASNQEKEFVSPSGIELLESGEQPPSLRDQGVQIDTGALDETPNLLGSHLSFGQGSLELAMRSTPSAPLLHIPPIEVAPRRGRRILFDENFIVLSNKALKDSLNDTSKIVRKKRSLPDNYVDSWRMEKLARKEQIFTEPLLTGMSEDLHDICVNLSAKPQLATVEEPMQEATDQHAPDIVPQPDVTQGIAAHQGDIETGGDLNIQTEQQEGDILRIPSVQDVPDREPEISHRNTDTSANGSGHGERGEGSPVPPAELDVEVERLRRDEGDAGTSIIPEYTPTAVFLTPTRGDDMPTVLAGSPKSVQEGQSTFGPGFFPTPDLASSGESVGLDDVGASDPHRIQQPRFSDVPELRKSPGSDELHFLDVDGSVPETPGTRDGSSLSVRARCVAQYLMDRSPSTPSPGDNSDTVSLNYILQNQPRKRCARMFYETLVLKSFDLIDVQQTESYGNITLKLTSALKAQF